MGEDGETQTVTIIAEKIKFSSIIWRKGKYRSKFGPLWETLRKLRMNTAIKITLDPGSKDMYQLVNRKFKDKNFKIMTKRLGLEGKAWAFAKVPLKKVT